MKLLDTSFLIDLQRELTTGRPGPAYEYLDAQQDDDLAISVVSVLEFLEGYESVPIGEGFLEPFLTLDVTRSVARGASRIRRTLRQQGAMIGDFDILIASTAMEAGAALVTADAAHFERIAGLQLARYR